MDAKLREAVLEMIGNVENPTQPWCSEYALRELDEVPRDTDGEPDLEALEKCLTQLEAEGLIESRSVQGFDECALVEDLKHPDYVREQESYSSLKEIVLAEARRQGFSCRWSPEHSWQLRGPDGGIVHSGPIRALAGHLGIQVID